MTENDPIIDDLPEEESYELADAVQALLPIPRKADESRSYLGQLHCENGYLVGTDAHILAALPVDQNGEAKDYFAPDIHKTDKIRMNGDGESLEVVCTHKNDKSGRIEPTPSSENRESFPDVQAVWPDTDEQLRVRVNPEYLSKILGIVGESSDESGVVLSFCRADESEGIDASSPVKVQGGNGAGLVMPLRLSE